MNTRGRPSKEQYRDSSTASSQHRPAHSSRNSFGKILLPLCCSRDTVDNIPLRCKKHLQMHFYLHFTQSHCSPLKLLPSPTPRTLLLPQCQLPSISAPQLRHLHHCIHCSRASATAAILYSKNAGRAMDNSIY